MVRWKGQIRADRVRTSLRGELRSRLIDLIAGKVLETGHTQKKSKSHTSHSLSEVTGRSQVPLSGGRCRTNVRSPLSTPVRTRKIKVW